MRTRAMKVFLMAVMLAVFLTGCKSINGGLTETAVDESIFQSVEVTEQYEQKSLNVAVYYGDTAPADSQVSEEKEVDLTNAGDGCCDY